MSWSVLRTLFSSQTLNLHEVRLARAEHGKLWDLQETVGCGEPKPRQRRFEQCLYDLCEWLRKGTVHDNQPFPSRLVRNTGDDQLWFSLKGVIRDNSQQSLFNVCVLHRFTSDFGGSTQGATNRKKSVLVDPRQDARVIPIVVDDCRCFLRICQVPIPTVLGR